MQRDHRPHPTRRGLLGSLAALGAGTAWPWARAQEVYPSRPVRLVVPFTPGGVTDSSGRVVADFLGKRLGQQVVVDNKPGASGNIGTAQVVNAAPDGYTLLLAFDGTMVINPHVFAKVPFDTMKDFAPVGKIGNATLILVAHPDVPAKTLQELIALSKTRTGGLAYGTSGIGGTPHVAGEMLAQRTGAKLEHVPYKGGGQAMTDVMGGAIPLVYTAVAGAQGHVKAGKLKAIAVSSAKRSGSLPDVPTFIESGVPDFVADSWVGLLAPGKTPAPILTRLNSELNAVLNDPALQERLATLGIEATPGSPEQFRDQMQRDLAAYGPIVKSAGIKVEQ
ncbi:MAG TPA: tripartite tricarboxylate transporter substrate binding protein [Burkholderiaceae bacterium]|nr:tripartite tricarboxylate transporter substrate binding protein [Burkholderiaceae bacterium]